MIPVPYYIFPSKNCPTIHFGFAALLERLGASVCNGGLQKDFLGPLFKKLGNHSSFYEWNLGSNRAQKWRKLTVAETSSHFVLLPSRASSELSFHFSGGTTGIKAWNVGREGHQLFQKIMKKDYLWRRKKCSQNIWAVTAEMRYYSYDISMYIFLCNLIFSAGIWRTGLSV